MKIQVIRVYTGAQYGSDRCLLKAKDISCWQQAFTFFSNNFSWNLTVFVNISSYMKSFLRFSDWTFFLSALFFSSVFLYGELVIVSLLSASCSSSSFGGIRNWRSSVRAAFKLSMDCLTKASVWDSNYWIGNLSYVVERVKISFLAVASKNLAKLN